MYTDVAKHNEIQVINTKKKLELRDYQKDISLKATNSCFIIAKMGCGKTASILDRLSKDIEANHNVRILIVAPKLVAENVWDAEINKFENFKWITYSKICGTLAKKQQAIQKDAHIYIISYDNLKLLAQQQFDIVVLDESTYIKSYASVRFKYVRALTNKAKKVICMTATPVPNSHLDLWAQMRVIDGGQRLGQTITTFRNWFMFKINMYTYDMTKENQERIQYKIKDVTCTVENYQGLPPISYIDHHVELDSKAKKIYNTLASQSLITLENKDLFAINAGALLNKLQQVTGGAIYENDSKNYITIHDLKLQVLDEIIEDLDENVIVVYQFKHELERILARYDFAVHIKDGGAIENWNNGKIKMLVVHPSSASFGLNLQNGGRRVIWYSQTWSNESYQQLNARVHRQLQKENVFIHHILVKDSVDEKMMIALNLKQLTHEQLLEYLLKNINKIS